jgi:predicted DNA-binding WGR domain protein
LTTIDSNNALDGAAIPLENADMKDAGEDGDPRLQMLVLERREPSRNMARFYVLAIEPTLFGDMALVREWGRLGSLGRRRLDLHASVASAGEALDVWLARKSRRGYQIRASIPRSWLALTINIEICLELDKFLFARPGRLSLPRGDTGMVDLETQTFW